MKYCKKCGAEISESASFCGNCGNPVGNTPKFGLERKKGIIVGGIGVIMLAVAVVMVLFAKGVFFGKSTEVSINDKNGAVQKESLVESFDELLTLTKDEIISKYEDKIINKDNYLESDISDYTKSFLMKYIFNEYDDDDVYIDYRLPGFEGDMLLSPQGGEGLEWSWGNLLPDGKTIDDYKKSYDALVHDFTMKYGEPYIDNGDDGHWNEYNVIRQGYIVGTYKVGWAKLDDLYQIGVGFERSNDKTYVGSGNSDTREEDSSNTFDSFEDEDEDEDLDEDEEW